MTGSPNRLALRASVDRPLRPLGPIDWLDQALSLVRGLGLGPVASALLAAMPLFWMVVFIYYMERIEGIRSLRWVFALGLSFAMVYRDLRIARVTRLYVGHMRRELVTAQAPLSARVATAGLHALGLCFWLAVGLVALRTWPPLLAPLVPVFAVRGAIAPGWLARSGCGTRQGWSSLGQALDDARGSRASAYAVELLVLLGIAGLFGNLFGVLGFCLSLAHSMFGLQVALLTAFSSPDNPLMLLLLMGLTVTVFEPVRAAISALAYVDARTRRDGADLVAAVDEAVRPRLTTLLVDP